VRGQLTSVHATSTVDAFDFKTATWDTTVAPLNTPRAYATAVALGDSIYVMGGADSAGGRIFNTVEVYDPTKNQWHYSEHMNDRREGAASVVYGDSIFVFGGAGSEGFRRTVEFYSPATGAWSVAPDTVVWGRAFHHAVKIGKYIYIFGGLVEVAEIFAPYRYVERYDLATGALQIGFAWKYPRAFFEVVVKGDSVFAISGYGAATTNEGFYGDVELLNFGALGSAYENESKVSLRIPRAGFIADTGDDGNIFIFGGISPDYNGGEFAVPSVEEVPDPSMQLIGVLEHKNANPQAFSLAQNYPNPFNPSTAISYQISSVSEVSLKVFDVLGREVATLVSAHQNPGEYEVVFDGSKLSSGVYFYKLTASEVAPTTAGKFIATKKMLLAK